METPKKSAYEAGYGSLREPISRESRKSHSIDLFPFINIHRERVRNFDRPVHFVFEAREPLSRTLRSIGYILRDIGTVEIPR